MKFEHFKGLTLNLEVPQIHNKAILFIFYLFHITSKIRSDYFQICSKNFFFTFL